jgi:hypothetical protein
MARLTLAGSHHKEETMWKQVMRVVKWISIPILLTASMFSRSAASYELLVDMGVCLGAVVLVQRAARVKEYFWASGFAAIAVVFCPLLLIVKVFLLMGFTCIAMFVILIAAFRTRSPNTALIVALLAVIPVAGVAQTADALDTNGKLRFHAERTYGPAAMVGFAAYAGVLQQFDSPREWGQGGAAYGKRFASTVAWSGIHSTLAFGLDTALHQDPRYYRSAGSGFWRRAQHALRGTVLTRTDAGRETLSTWRIGSAYGSAFLSNMWYPDRLNTVRLGMIQGSIGLGFDLAGNLGAEFWPDIRRNVFRRKVKLER